MIAAHSLQDKIAKLAKAINHHKSCTSTEQKHNIAKAQGHKAATDTPSHQVVLSACYYYYTGFARDGPLGEEQTRDVFNGGLCVATGSLARAC